MLQDVVNSLEQDQEQLAMGGALTTASPIASQLLDFSADDAADLFSEALLSTSDNVSSSDPAAIATDPSVPSCSYAALSMDPDTLSSLLDSDELMQAISTGSTSYPVPTLQVSPQDRFDGFSTAAYSVGAMLPPGYADECLMPAGMASYVGMEQGGTTTPCPFMDPVMGGSMCQGGMDGGGGEGYFPAMVGPVEPGMGLQEVAEYQNTRQYGMEQLQHVYSTNPADLQVFGDGRQQQHQEMPSLDDSTFKVGRRLSAEERKEKIHRYMKKRNERNFSKKIKYACRKTLADSRPRVRGRFAKNEESGETARPSSSHMEYDDDEEVLMKEDDIFDPSDILQHVSGVNSFKYNHTLESWI